MFRSRFSKFLVLALMVISLATTIHPTSAQTISRAGTYDESLTHDARVRTYRVHVPDLETPANGFPLLVVLHGGGGNGKQVERSTGFSDLADREGFIAVYPDGTGRLQRVLTWNAHNCCAYAHDQGVDDIGFISALIDQVNSDYDVDASRIYVTGHSNGAMMAFRIACELSDKIAATAPYAGALNTDSCAATEPVAMLIMNGEEDDNVPVAGGISEDDGMDAEDDRVDQPTSFGVETWATINGCDPTPIVTDAASAQISVYRGCADDLIVEQVLIHGWGHGWPDLENGSPIDATSFIWSFVSQFVKQQS